MVKHLKSRKRLGMRKIEIRRIGKTRAKSNGVIRVPSIDIKILIKMEWPGDCQMS
jgi:hypothetical protein